MGEGGGGGEGRKMEGRGGSNEIKVQWKKHMECKVMNTKRDLCKERKLNAELFWETERMDRLNKEIVGM